MTGFTNRTSQGILNHITGISALYSMPTSYIALYTAAGTDVGIGGGGFTEVSGGSYARKAIVVSDWSAASGTAPSTISNANGLIMPTATADWGIVIAWGILDAATAGNLLCWDYLGNYPWRPAVVNAATPAVITAPQHGYVSGDLLQWTQEHGGITPTFAASNFTGALTVVATTADTFTVTNTGTAVNTSGTGSGMVRKFIAQAIINGATVTFPPASITIVSS